MKTDGTIVVVGLGEVGRPLLKLISKHHKTMGVDIKPCKLGPDNIDIMHICYPFQVADFIGEAARYIELYHPKLTIIDSSVPVGTTRSIAQRTGARVAHSPVRGKHIKMLEDIARYVKFVGALDRVTAEQVAQHFVSIGLATQILSSPEATELAKLTETTYFGLLIAWAQELERACDKLGPNYDEVTSFYEGIEFFPPLKYFPGIIGGHCVLPNIELLRRSVDSELVESIKISNNKKIAREAGQVELRCQPEKLRTDKPSRKRQEMRYHPVVESLR